MALIRDGFIVYLVRQIVQGNVLCGKESIGLFNYFVLKN